MALHILSHPGSTVKCCGMEYSNHESLTDHRMASHGEEQKGKGKSKYPIKCPDCHKSVACASLYRHWTVVHKHSAAELKQLITQYNNKGHHS